MDRPPLIAVLAKVQFTPILKIADYIPDFQEIVRKKGFPSRNSGSWGILEECLPVSSTPRIHFVVEGPTDYIVLDALVERFLQTDNYIPTQIQPPTSEYADHQGPLGGGWRGVLRWCREIGNSSGGLSESAALAACFQKFGFARVSFGYRIRVLRHDGRREWENRPHQFP